MNSYYMVRAEAEKAAHTLEGILRGIVIDGKINSLESQELLRWIGDNKSLLRKPPMSEIVLLAENLSRGQWPEDMSEEELFSFLREFRSDSVYFNEITADLQQLHGILHGVLADGQITKEELVGLKNWMVENERLQGLFPYDEIFSLVVSVLKDGVVTPDEENMLKTFFSEFSLIEGNHGPDETVAKQLHIDGICALDPDIQFEGKSFCFTGGSKRASRRELCDIVTSRRGQVQDRVTEETDYLVVGSGGSPYWAFSCYGRKVERAMNLRRDGHPVSIVHESDFWDALG